MCEKCDANDCICKCEDVELFADLDRNVWGKCRTCKHYIYGGFGSD